MNVYMKAPYSEIFTDRDKAARDIADLFCTNDEAAADFIAYYNSDEDPAYMITAADLPEHIGCFEEWANYRAYDLLDEATAAGHGVLYGVHVYTDAEAEALEERAADLFDPWACDEARVAAFFDIYTAGDGLLAMVEALRELLAEAPELAAEIEQLSSDLLSYYEQRQQKEVLV